VDDSSQYDPSRVLKEGSLSCIAVCSSTKKAFVLYWRTKANMPYRGATTICPTSGPHAICVPANRRNSRSLRANGRNPKQATAVSERLTDSPVGSGGSFTRVWTAMLAARTSLSARQHISEPVPITALLFCAIEHCNIFSREAARMPAFFQALR
jgi:hypothetical protein